MRPNSDSDTLLRAGAASHAAGDLIAAEQLYRQVLKQRPGDANAHNLLGVLARQRGDSAAALRHTERALAAQPEAPAFLANRGAALAEAGRLAEAVAALRGALARRPKDAVTLRNLGQALCALGDPAAALDPLAAAVRLSPEAPEPRLALAHARRESGDAEGAAAAAAAALDRAGALPAMAAQARFLLAALGHGAAPDRAPAAYVRDLFDQFAPRFDAELTGALGYATPALLAALLAEAGCPPRRTLRVLDLGCGTGLSGVSLAPFARRLEGLDLSPRMLAEARKRGLYDALHEADLLDWLPGQPGRYGLIAAVDVLNYLGDLAPALAAMAGALAPGGIAAFSIEAMECEAGEGAPYALGEAMRFRHDPMHVAALAAASGLVLRVKRAATLRTEKSVPVAGALFVFTRPG